MTMEGELCSKYHKQTENVCFSKVASWNKVLKVLPPEASSSCSGWCSVCCASPPKLQTFLYEAFCCCFSAQQALFFIQCTHSPSSANDQPVLLQPTDVRRQRQRSSDSLGFPLKGRMMHAAALMQHCATTVRELRDTRRLGMWIDTCRPAVGRVGCSFI